MTVPGGALHIIQAYRPSDLNNNWENERRIFFTFLYEHLLMLHLIQYSPEVVNSSESCELLRNIYQPLSSLSSPSLSSVSVYLAVAVLSARLQQLRHVEVQQGDLQVG